MDDKSAKLAARQHGVVTVDQLAACGLSKDAVYKRVRAGRLHRVHRGVYAVGHPGLSNEGRWMAAVLACGEGAALSHRSAAELWQLLKPRPGPIHVSIASSAGRKSRRGLRIHRSPSLQIVHHDCIAVTTVPRTLQHLRGVVEPWELRRAVRQAEFLDLPTELTTDHTRSDLETAFLRLCRRHGIPSPEVNVRVGKFTVDFLWREQRLAVETDGYAAHRGRQAFLDDRQRELELSRLGVRLRRFSDDQIENQADVVAAAVQSELGNTISPRTTL